MSTFSRYNMPDKPTDPEEWEEVLVITGDIYFYQDPTHRLFIDVPDMEEMGAEITVDKAKEMIRVLMNHVSRFEGAKVVSEEEKS